jgi:glycosyltransferase involved in cell wall biosynthesis
MSSTSLTPLPGAKSAPVTEQGQAIDLTIVIPAFNERHGIRKTIEQVRQALAGEPYTTEIIVVDDGSTDGTAAEAQACDVRVLRQPTNFGYGAALKAGIGATSSEYVLIIDADGTYPADAIPDLMAQAVGADMVVGARKINNNNIPMVRKPAKWFLNKLASFLTGRHIPDINSGLRVMRRSALNRFLPILPNGFSFTSTITLAMLSTNHHVIYRPIEYHARVGSSKIRPTHFLDFVILVLRTVVLFNPLKVFLPLGTLLCLIGVLKLIQDIVRWNLSETAVLAFLAAIIVWSLGLMADMMSRLQLFPPGNQR